MLLAIVMLSALACFPRAMLMRALFTLSRAQERLSSLHCTVKHAVQGDSCVASACKHRVRSGHESAAVVHARGCQERDNRCVDVYDVVLTMVRSLVLTCVGLGRQHVQNLLHPTSGQALAEFVHSFALSPALCFVPGVTIGWVDVHFAVNGGSPQNQRMVSLPLRTRSADSSPCCSCLSNRPRPLPLSSSTMAWCVARAAVHQTCRLHRLACWLT